MFVIDDMSWAHTGFAGCEFVDTPNFDRIAREGAYFHNAFATAPVCTPTRGCLLTGLHPWQQDEGINLLSSLPPQFPAYPNVLAEAGYFSGYTGKGWGPGWWGGSGRKADPCGKAFYGVMRDEAPTEGMSKHDLAGNFRVFLEQCPPDQPFCFWFGSFEPHVLYEAGSGIGSGMDPDAVTVPGFLPDTKESRTDLLDYAFEIEQLDKDLGKCLDALEEAGELEDTLVIVVGDNGMPFPAAKHTLYEYGTHVPLAIRWGGKIPAGQRVRTPVVSEDLTATIYAAAGLQPAMPISGESLLAGLMDEDYEQCLPDRDHVILAHERGNTCRDGLDGYPMRAIRTDRYLYIRNYRPERWPVGNPPEYGDVDPLLIKDLLIEKKDDPGIRRFHKIAMGKRPAEELFDIREDPYCLNNLADDPAFEALAKQLHDTMDAELKADGDFTAIGQERIFEAFEPRVGPWVQEQLKKEKKQ